MAANVIAIERHNTHVRSVLCRIIDTYDAAGLPYLLLKGEAVASTYLNPAHRTGGDIDFYLNPADCNKAQELLFGNTDLPKNETRHYEGMLGGICIENHFRLAHSALPRYRDFEQELLSDAIRLPLQPLSVGARKVTCPSPTFHALFMLEHMAFHLPGGLGLRQLCDWARFMSVNSEQINRQAAARIIQQFGFERIANIFTLICIDQLGMAERHSLIPVIRDKKALRDTHYVLRQILNGGNFGRHFDLLHSSKKHLKLPGVLRKLITFAVMLRNRRKYALISPTLLRETIYSHRNH